MKLVIVESPTKCNTIQRYLGKDYVVKASMGHIRDLATSGKDGLGVDIEHDFAPTYVINKEKRDVVNELKALAEKADEVILATDPDREGEAISWHLAKVLGLDVFTNKRLEFHEITRDSISKAIENPRIIEGKLVASQETRRILDRIIGFKLSSLLKTLIKSESAGRVQSATLKLIYDHQQEIDQFVPKEYWNIIVKLLINGKEVTLSHNDSKEDGDISNKEMAKKLLESIGDKVSVTSIKTSTRSKEAPEPFMTATLQQEAFSKLGFSTAKTQSVAQSLYEGININGEHTGLITYIRVDSTRLSETYIQRARNYIVERFGEEYLGKVRKSKKEVLSQDAHEAIRPTKNHNYPEKMRPYLTEDQFALYKLIYNRTLAFLMKAKKDEVMDIELSAGDVKFKTEYKRNIFKGYELVYKDEDNKSYTNKLPDISVGDTFPILEKEMEQKFTQPPSLYNEAKLVRLMQEVGIGRPSTYASTISNLKNRKYVSSKKGEISITDKGKENIDTLQKFFPDIVDAKYTATMESKLDDVQIGNESRTKTLSKFYKPFMKEFSQAKKAISEMEKVPAKETGEKCPKCGAPLVYKQGRNGEFVGCSNFPKCRYIKKDENLEYVEGKFCPVCGKQLVYRYDKKNKKKFIACSGYPDCSYIEKKAPSKIEYSEKDYVKKCPDCDGYLVKRKGQYNYFLACTNYPKCKHIERIKRGKHK